MRILQLVLSCSLTCLALFSGSAPALSATLEDAAPLKALLPGAQIVIKKSAAFDVRVFRAVSGEPAECFILYSPTPLSRLNQMGYRLDQISVGAPVPGLTQQQCYDLPMR